MATRKYPVWSIEHLSDRLVWGRRSGRKRPNRRIRRKWAAILTTLVQQRSGDVFVAGRAE
jgi:hypothetical protein